MTTGDVSVSELAYRDDDLELLGVLARPADGDTKRPGVLIAPAVFGMTDHPRDRARMIAELGYVALVADLFGGGASFPSLEEAMPRGRALMADVPTWLRRLEAALAALRAQPGVASERVAAIGFCLGGTGVLELALSGAEVRAVVSFHGGLTLSDPRGVSRASILICTGADDPLVPESDVIALQGHLRESKADWQVETYGGALHAFADPASNSFGTPAAGYSPRADHRSWQSMKRLFAERLDA